MRLPAEHFPNNPHPAGLEASACGEPLASIQLQRGDMSNPMAFGLAIAKVLVLTGIGPGIAIAVLLWLCGIRVVEVGIERVSREVRAA